MNMPELILRNQLQAYLAGQPETGENARVESLRRIGGRGASGVYAFELVHDEAGEAVTQKLVLKTYPASAEGVDRALKERHALYHLRTARYPVPAVVSVETETDLLGGPFVIMQQVEGRTLGAALETADERERRGLVAQFVGLLVDLHDRGPEALVRREIAPLSEHALITREIHTMRVHAGQREQQEFLPVIDWLFTRRKHVASGGMVVNHRNFTLSNVIVDPSGRMSVVDWGWQLGDARFDLAWALLDLERNGLAGLRDEVLAEYERVTGRPVADLPYFEAVAALRWLMDTVHDARRAGILDGGQDRLREAMLPAVADAASRIAVVTGIELPGAADLLKP
jgi:aminoglycoside phosphotransferase (APT) family kinase protein